MRKNGLLPVLLVLVSVSVSAFAGADDISAAFGRLKGHVEGGSTLSGEQIDAQAAVIEKNIGVLGESAGCLKEALELVSFYEDTVGALFINKATRRGYRRKQDGLEIHKAVFAVQQGIIDEAYTAENLEKFMGILKGAAFKTADYFPGPVEAKADAGKVYSVKINASQPACWAIPVMDNETAAMRPTGCYLVPGDVAEITVPESLAGKGFTVRVGAHRWDLVKKPIVKRLDRVSIVYPIKEKVTQVANPLGGGIYIEVPYLADEGIVDVKIKNVVRSPFFSATKHHKTSLKEWKNIGRKHPGPWADFESDKFMMQVPTKWIYNYDDPVSLMADWDKSMDVVSDLFGLPRIRPKTVLYLQTDVIFRGGANFPGYPQSNFRYNPRSPENGNSGHWLLKGPQHGGATIFHELGHAHKFTKFRGEVEAVVNVPFVAVLNKGFGVDLDRAFGESFKNKNMSLDQAAMTWMVTENFRDGKPMDISYTPKNQVRYQHRGYGRYVEIANLFGWGALEDFWKSVQVDYRNGIKYRRNADPTDSRILRMSKAAGVDLTPLIHFWGVQPENPEELKKAMVKNDLKPSVKIYDRLNHYKTVIPMNNKQFVEHANTIYPRGIRKGRDHRFGVGYYHAWLKKYDESHGKAAQKTLQEIIDTYFPNGRPDSG